VHNTILSAAGALIRDEQGRILLLEPTYKDHWEIPGGMIEAGESPRDACTREVQEELGLHATIGDLLVVDWAPHPTQGDRVLFVFDGGTLTADEVAAIRLQAEELKSYAFLPPDEAFHQLIPRHERRKRAAVRAQEEGRSVYLEHGTAHGA
jgi:ADP-ribose pyrophosphatase YjhB (NUDIX family)